MRHIWLLAVFLSTCTGGPHAQCAEPTRPTGLVGYTWHRTNLPGGRLANIKTSRAILIRADGSGRRELAPDLSGPGDTWTQFAGWSPDGGTAIIARGWESAENARWEEEHQTFRFTPEGWLLDSYVVELATGKTENLTAVDRVSFYNAGLFFWPEDSQRLGFTALIGGVSKPFSMNRDGRDKRDLSKESSGFAYGFSSSRDGKRISYHENYQVYLADADGSQRVHIATGQPFNFAPAWSPDGAWVVFLAGEHYNCHPHIVRADGTGLRKLADRAGYRGVMEFLDVPDFHGGSSDTPVWAVDGQSVFYTAKAGSSIELFRVSLAGENKQLTNSPAATLHYHPRPSPDGQWLAFGSRRDGARNLFVMRLADRAESQMTNAVQGEAAMHPHWQPVSR